MIGDRTGPGAQELVQIPWETILVVPDMAVLAPRVVSAVDMLIMSWDPLSPDSYADNWCVLTRAP